MKSAIAFLLFLTFRMPNALGDAIALEQIKLPPNFSIEVYARDIVGARSMTWGKDGTLFVGSRETGNVYAIDKNRKKFVIAKKLNSPNGVAYSNGTLYVAEIHRLIKFDNIDARLANPPPYTVIHAFPKEEFHGWKFIAFGPNNKLFVPQGSPCNVCSIRDPYAAIRTMKKDGTDLQIFARGVRNTVGFDWHPKTHELWFTDNGRDEMGDDVPADELNHAPTSGLHFGYPFCHQGDILDPDFGKGKKCEDYVPPVRKLGPHVAALGMRFYTGSQFPAEYQNQIFIAEHGSWNRTVPLGYRITLVRLDASGKSQGYEVFAEGWLQNGSAWGRPVDVINAPDGSLLVSDDSADVIYKIRYNK